MLKGIGVGAIIKLVLAVLVASLFISISTIGSLGQAIQQSFDQIGEATDYTVEVEDKEDHTAEEVLSGLHSFVVTRSFEDGCNQIDDLSENSEGAFPTLQGTHLTANPPCYGADSTVLRSKGWLDASTPDIIEEKEDNFMPGIYSREQFEIKQNLELESSGDTAIEKSLGTVTDLSLQQISNEVENAEGDSELKDSLEEFGTNAGVRGLNGIVGWMELTTFGNLPDIVSTTAGVVEKIAENDVRPTTVVLPKGELQNRTNFNGNVDPSDLENELPIKLQLCKGDEGYIQSNRGTIGDGSYSGENPIYPVMVIEELGEPCGSEYGRTNLIPGDVRNDGRLLHITGETDEPFPHVRQPGKFGTKDYAFDLMELNENKPEEFEIIGSAGRNIEFDFREDLSEACIIGMYDFRDSTVNAKGGIYLRQGVRIPYDGTFPDRDGNEIVLDNLEDRTDRNVPPYPSAQNLYDQYANQGFVGGDWGSSGINNKILYDSNGERKFELYGDLLCAPHENNQNFDNNHGQWMVCSPEHDGETKTVNQQSWTCNAESGRWEQENEGPELVPAPETMTVEWDETSSNSEDWLSTDSNSFQVDTGEASADIYMDWETAVPNNWEEISVTVTPAERGHLRIAGQGPENYQDYPYFYFGGDGYTGKSENIYLNDYGDDFDNDFEPLTVYEPGETYTFTFNRVENSLEVKENGESVWKNSNLEVFNFQRLRLWHTDGHEDTEATIENIEVVYPQPIESDEEDEK